MSPEVLKGDNQSFEVDTWALGILLYELFHDATPFKGRTPRELLNNILEKKMKIGNMVPKDAKDLILKLLTIEPIKRITLEEVKEHPFVLRYPCDLHDGGMSDKKELISEKETEISERDVASKTVADKDAGHKESKKDADTESSKEEKKKPGSTATDMGKKTGTKRYQLGHLESKTRTESRKKMFQARSLTWSEVLIPTNSITNSV